MKNLAIGVVCTVVGFVAGMFTYKVYSERTYDETIDELNRELEEHRRNELERKKQKYEEIASTYGSCKEESFDIASEDQNPIKVITEDEYSCNNGFEKRTWTYYQSDDVVADDVDEMIDWPENSIGDDFRDEFGQQNDDPDTVYIRNRISGTDYEVIRVDCAYCDIIGIGDLNEA